LPAPTQKLAGPDLPVAGNFDAFVIALDAVTGAAKAGFGTGGIQTFGGTLTDEAFGVAANGGTVYVAGHFSSTDAKNRRRGTGHQHGREPGRLCACIGRRHWLGEIGFLAFPGSGIQTFGGSGNESGVE